MSEPRLPMDEDRSLISGEMLNAAVTMSQAEYEQWWIARVKARCSITESGCWLWRGFVDKEGYGTTSYRSKGVRVHRKMFEITHGVKLVRLQYVCHECDVKHCCNPDHLWQGTPLENSTDAYHKGLLPELKVTHCPRGHEYTPENTYVLPAKSGRTARNCKTCMRIRTSSPEHKAKARERMRLRRAQQRSQVTP